jgi:spore coat protein U-like protein
MKRNIVRSLTAALIASAAITSAPVQAQTTVATGVIDVSLTLTSACTIETFLYTGASDAAPTRVIETLPFGSHPSTATTARASTVIGYQCSQGSSPKLSFDGGLNRGSTTTRNMKFTAGSNDFLIPYKLYSDNYVTEIAIDGSINLAGNFTISSATIYAEATIPAGNSIGTYTDKVTVTLTL